MAPRAPGTEGTRLKEGAWILGSRETLSLQCKGRKESGRGESMDAITPPRLDVPLPGQHYRALGFIPNPPVSQKTTKAPVGSGLPLAG